MARVLPGSPPELSNEKGKILEITGLVGSTPDIERSLGFYNGLLDYPDFEVAKSIEGARMQTPAQQLTDNLFNETTDFDLISYGRGTGDRIGPFRFWRITHSRKSIISKP